MAKKSEKKSTSKPKSDAAKAEDRKALAHEDIHAEYVRDGEGHSAIVLTVDGTEFTLSEPALLRLRSEVNEVAAGLAR